MENTIKIFTYNNTNKVRTVEKDGEAWFVGKDVAEALGYEAPRNAIKKFVEYEDKQVHRISASGQMREVFIINEAGLYSLIFSSKLPSAKQFKHWVTHEVLPDIRKHGMYMSDKVLSKSPEEFDKIFSLYAEEKNKVKALTEQIENDRAATVLGKCVFDMKGSLTVDEVAKLFYQYGYINDGRNKIYELLRTRGYLSKQKNMKNKPTQKGLDTGFTCIELNNDGTFTLSTKTRVTKKGLRFLCELMQQKYFPLFPLAIEETEEMNL